MENNANTAEKTVLEQSAQAGRDAAAQPGAASETLKIDPLRPAETDRLPPLLRSLSTLIRLKGGHVSPQFLLSGLVGAGHVSVAACIKSAERAGLSCHVASRRTLNEISPLTFPCILLLQGGQSCVLLRLEKDAEGKQKARVIMPDLGNDPQLVDRAELERQYTGYAVLGAMKSQADSRTNILKAYRPKRWFWDVLKHYSPIYAHVAVASVVVNCIAVVSSLFVMNVYDRVIPNNAHETLWVLAAGVMIAYIFDYLLRFLRGHFVDVAGRNADVVISSRLVEKVLSMRMDARPESTGALVNNLREFESLREFFSSSTFLALIDLPFLLLFLAIIWYIGGEIVLVPLLAMPVLLFVGFLTQHQSQRSTENSYRHSMQKNALLVEMVNGLETIKLSQAERRMQRLWDSVTGISAQSSLKARKYSSRIVNFALFLTHTVTVVMVIWGVYRIGDGLMSMGGLIGCNILLGRIMAPLMQMAGLFTRLQNSRVALKALDSLMQLPSENEEQASVMDLGLLRGGFVLDRVSFSYPGSDELALDRVSLHIRPGEKVGVLGRMGSGKSTLGKLLCGLYEPKEGSVSFGGVDLRQLATSEVRGRMGVLPQEVVLFYGSVRDNIALGDPTINDQMVHRAAVLAGVDGFVKRHPAGYGAQVGEQGRNLSGGQRQAVGLARALVRDPDILILDEPTSNMDTDSELRVQQNMARVLENRTLILFTHRLTMLRVVDRLLVMENGRIVMDGPRDQVLRQLQQGGRKQSQARAGQTGAQPAAQAQQAQQAQPAQAAQTRPAPQAQQTQQTQAAKAGQIAAQAAAQPGQAAMQARPAPQPQQVQQIQAARAGQTAAQTAAQPGQAASVVRPAPAQARMVPRPSTPQAQPQPAPGTARPVPRQPVQPQPVQAQPVQAAGQTAARQGAVNFSVQQGDKNTNGAAR